MFRCQNPEALDQLIKYASPYSLRQTDVTLSTMRPLCLHLLSVSRVRVCV